MRSLRIIRTFPHSCCAPFAPACEQLRRPGNPFTRRSFSSVNLTAIILLIAAASKAALLAIGDGSVVKLLDEHERTLAFAEVALGQIKSLRQTAVPRNYEIWYVYATGYNAPLNKIINETLARNGRLSEADLEQIYETYLSHIKTSDRIDKVGAGVIGEIDDLMNLITETLAMSAADDASLTGASEKLANAKKPEQIKAVIEELVKSTREMRDTNKALENRLSRSKTEIRNLHHSA